MTCLGCWEQLNQFSCSNVPKAHLQVLMGSMSHSSMGLSTTTVCTLSLHCTGPWFRDQILNRPQHRSNTIQTRQMSHLHDVAAFWCAQLFWDLGAGCVGGVLLHLLLLQGAHLPWPLDDANIRHLMEETAPTLSHLRLVVYPSFTSSHFSSSMVLHWGTSSSTWWTVCLVKHSDWYTWTGTFSGSKNCLNLKPSGRTLPPPPRPRCSPSSRE